MLCHPWPANITAYHYGHLSSAVRHYENCLTAGPKMLLQANQKLEATSILMFMAWSSFALDFQRPGLRQALEKLGLTLSTADSEVDRLVTMSTLPIRPRGETTPGFAWSAEAQAGIVKATIALTAGDNTEAQELAASLPSWDEQYAFACARCACACVRVYRICQLYALRENGATLLTCCVHCTASRSRSITFVEASLPRTHCGSPTCMKKQGGSMMRWNGARKLPLAKM